MVVQLFVLLLLLAYAGKWLDQNFDLGNDYFTAGLLLLGTVAYLYKIVKELS